MAIALAVANQKGGVGKTTTTACLALELVRLGQRVLAVDVDPQASLTLYFAEDPRRLDAQGRTLHAFLLEDRPLASVICGAAPALLASSIRLATSESELLAAWNGASLLRERLREAADMFDVILLDCCPSLGLLTVNALAAADRVLVPVKTDYLSLMGVQLLLETVDRVRIRLNPDLEVMGVLPTMHDQRNSHDREVLAELRERLAPNVKLYPPIKRSTVFDQVSVGGLPHLREVDLPKVAEIYREIAREVVAHGRKQTP